MRARGWPHAAEIARRAASTRLVVATIATLVAVAPSGARAGAATVTPATVPRIGADSTGTTTTTTTMTTTRTGPDRTSTSPLAGTPGTATPATTTTTTTVLAAAIPSDAPAGHSDPPPVGPPDVTDVQLPSDSLAAAQAELDVLQARLTNLDARARATDRRLTADGIALRRARHDEALVVAVHREHAVAMYEQMAAGELFDQLVAWMSPDTNAARRREMIDAANRADRRHAKRVRRRLRALERTVATERRRRGELAREIAGDRAELAIVLGKLVAATARLTLVGPQTPAMPGPGPLAAGARDAETALDAVTAAQQAAAVAAYDQAASPTDPALAGAKASTATALLVARGAYASKVVALSGLVGRALHADGTPLIAVWNATPAPAMKAVLFALSQVGKPYVYATAGPDTYDCSGLTMRAWAEDGVGLPHFSGAQLHVGVPVAPARLRPGDLLAYGLDGSEHVVLSLGNGWVVQAKGRDFGVVVTAANLDPHRGFAGVSRPIP